MNAGTNHLSTMTYRQLQKECRKANLKAAGKARDLRKRLLHHTQQQERQSAAKRQKKSAADDLVCPISLELPWDPVMAEDGQIYDREAIEMHFEHHRGSGGAAATTIKSPVTNERMGKRLTLARQVRNHIASLVESGVIDGDLATKWRERKAQQQAKNKLLKDAQAGDGEAMYNIGVNHSFGQEGFKEDDKLAFQWYQKAHQAGFVPGTACLGESYLTGIGVTRSSRLGLVYISHAASMGSNLAAYTLGMAFADGSYGLSVDNAEAIHMLGKSIGDAAYDHLSERFQDRALEKLVELTAHT